MIEVHKFRRRPRMWLAWSTRRASIRAPPGLLVMASKARLSGRLRCDDMRTRGVVQGLVAALGLVAVLGLGACSSSPPTHMSAAECAKAVQPRGTVVLDVRTPQEFAGGHLPRAVNIDVEAAGFTCVIDLAGGLGDWVKAGGPLTTG